MLGLNKIFILKKTVFTYATSMKNNFVLDQIQLLILQKQYASGEYVLHADILRCATHDAWSRDGHVTPRTNRYTVSDGYTR